MTVAIGLGPLIDVAQLLSGDGEDQRHGPSMYIRGALILLLGLSVRRHRTLGLLRGPMLPLLLLALYGVLWTAVRGDPYDGVVFCMRILFLVLVYLSAFECAMFGLIDARWMSRVAWVVVSAAVASQATGRLLNVTSVYGSDFDFPGLTGEPSILADTVCGVLPLFLVRTTFGAAQVGGVLVALASVAGTQRRSAILAALVGIIVFGLATLVTRRRRAPGRVLTLFAVLAGAVYIASEYTPVGGALAARFQDLNFAGGGTASGRREFQWIVIEHVLQRDIIDTVFGEGLGAVNRTLASNFGLAIGSHNDWLDVLSAFGVIGAVLLLWVHVSLVRVATRVSGDRHSGGVTAAAMALAMLVVLGVTTGGTLNPTSAPVFMLFGFLSATSVGGQRPRSAARRGEFAPLSRGERYGGVR